MPKEYTVRNVGRAGAVWDQDPISLPPEAWSDVRDVKFRRGKAYSQPGRLAISPPFTKNVLYFMGVQGPTDYYWHFATEDEIHEWDGGVGSSDERTRATGDYTGDHTNRWNGSILHGIPILNNGKDSPQFQATPGSTAYADLTWDSGGTWTAEGVTAKVVRAWRNVLVALNTTESGTTNPYVLRVSTPADPGAVPSTWDETDATALAVKTTLSDTGGHLVDCLPLGDDLIVYTEDSFYRVSYVGAPNVLRISTPVRGYGLLAQDCVVDIGGRHVVMGKTGLYIHSGTATSVVPLGQDTVQNAIYDELDEANFIYSFLAHNILEKEVWICTPDRDSGVFPNVCHIWSYGERGAPWTRITIPAETRWITVGNDVDATVSAESTTGEYTSRLYNPTIERMHGMSGLLAAASTEFSKYDTALIYGAAHPDRYVERQDIVLGSTRTLQTITGVYPELQADSGSVDIKIGHKMKMSDSYTWTSAMTFTPSTDIKVDCLVTGALFAIKFEIDDGTSWTLTGYTLEYEEAGLRS